VPGFLSWVSRDFYALKPHGDFVTGIHETFINSIDLEEGGRKPGYITIPTWAVLGSSDFWVDKLSAGLGIPARRKRMVRDYRFVRQSVRQVWTSIPPDRREALNGVWEGRIDLQPYPSARIELRLTVNKNDINGEAVYSFNPRLWQVWRGGGKRELHVSGSFRENRFVQLNYKSKDETAIHFGSILLELRGDGRTLVGRWMGYSPTTEEPACGGVYLSRG
jgi:hypothetical protein